MRRTISIGLLALVLLGGCASAPRDKTGFASVDTVVVNAGFEDTWQATKAVLREMEMDIYTRDTAGEFVAFTRMERRYRVLTPKRIKLTIEVHEVSGQRTRVSVETVQQVYGVTPLTYPDWHDRQTNDNELAVSLLDAVKARTSKV